MYVPNTDRRFLQSSNGSPKLGETKSPNAAQGPKSLFASRSLLAWLLCLYTFADIPAFMHVIYMDTPHACMHTYMQVCMHTNIPAYVPTHTIHIRIHACLHNCIHCCLPACLLTCLPAYLLTYRIYLLSYIHAYIHFSCFQP